MCILCTDHRRFHRCRYNTSFGIHIFFGTDNKFLVAVPSYYKCVLHTLLVVFHSFVWRNYDKMTGTFRCFGYIHVNDNLSLKHLHGASHFTAVQFVATHPPSTFVTVHTPLWTFRRLCWVTPNFWTLCYHRIFHN